VRAYSPPVDVARCSVRGPKLDVGGGGTRVYNCPLHVNALKKIIAAFLLVPGTKNRKKVTNIQRLAGCSSIEYLGERRNFLQCRWKVKQKSAGC